MGNHSQCSCLKPMKTSKHGTFATPVHSTPAELQVFCLKWTRSDPKLTTSFFWYLPFLSCVSVSRQLLLGVFKFSCKTLQPLYTWIWVEILPGKSFHTLTDWITNVWTTIFRSSSWPWLCHSRTVEATPALPWLYVSRHCHVKRWTLTPVSGCFHRILCIWLNKSFSHILPVLATEKHPHRIMLPPPCLSHQTRGFFSPCFQSSLKAVWQTPSGLSLVTVP